MPSMVPSWDQDEADGAQPAGGQHSAACKNWSPAMASAAISFLVCQFHLGLGDSIRYRWSRLEVGDTERLDRRFTTETVFVPLPRDHECFQHAPRDQRRLQYDFSASWAIDRQLLQC